MSRQTTAQGVESGTRDAAAEAARDALFLALRAIPPGRVVTYGQLAELAGLPGRARLVGRVLSQLPSGTALPWHRVVNAAGRIAERAGDGPREQRARLLAEGVEVLGGRIDLKRYRFDPGC